MAVASQDSTIAKENLRNPSQRAAEEQGRHRSPNDIPEQIFVIWARNRQERNSVPFCEVWQRTLGVTGKGSMEGNERNLSTLAKIDTAYEGRHVPRPVGPDQHLSGRHYESASEGNGLFFDFVR